MTNIAALEEYFLITNKEVLIKQYRISIWLQEDDHTFLLNLKIREPDKKQERLVKIRIGLGRDAQTNSLTHNTTTPHFEIDLYRREDGYSASMYFTLASKNEEELTNYAKGTIVLIKHLLDNFLEQHNIPKEQAGRILHQKAIEEELIEYEGLLFDALVECFNNSRLVVRDQDEPIIIRTIHNLQKYLNKPDLQPLYLPLRQKLEDKTAKK